MISNLPNELLYNIAGRLKEYEIYSLIQCNSRLLRILRHKLYEENIFYNDGWALIWAILNGQSQTMLHALDTGTTSLGEALAIAAETGHEDAVNMLLTQEKASFHPNYLAHPHAMDMSWTCQDRINSRSAAVASLRQHKPLNFFSAYDALSPLSRVLLESHMGVAKALIESGKVDIGHPEHEGRTPLSIIAEYGGLASLRLLLDLGNPNLYLKDHKKGRTPFSYSTENDDSAVSKALLDTGFTDVDQEDEEGRTPFVYAIENGNIDAIEALLHMKIEKDQGYCLLGSLWQIWGRFHSQDPSQVENPQYIRFWEILIECEELNINVEDENDMTPLHAVAGGYGGGEVIRLIINSGKMCSESLNSRDWDGRDALSYAASDDSRDNEGRTPLSYVAGSGIKETVQLLVETSRIDINFRDTRGRTPFSHAAASASKECVQILMETDDVGINLADNQLRSPLTYAAISGAKEIVQLLLETGKFDLEHRDRDSRTPFSHAAGSNAKECIKLFIETGGIDLESRDVQGRTPLSYAAEAMDYDIIRMLANTCKVDFDTQDNQGRTPISYAVANRQIEFTNFCTNLKEYPKRLMSSKLGAR